MARVHTDFLKAYMKFTSYSEAPDKFHFWTGVSTIAGALRRKVWIDQKYFTWTPNFYIIFVAPPGVVSKSTTASIGMRLLKQVKGIKFGPDASTWQSLTQSMAHSTEEYPMPDKSFFPMSALTIASSELGTFLNPRDSEMVDALVSWWDGQEGVWEKKTKMSGDDKIINPWINIVACTTPAWIAGNFPEYMIGGGFTSRTIFVYGDKKRHLVPYPADAVPPEFKRMEEELVHDLREIAQIAGEYQLSPEAKRFGVEWYEQHSNKKHHELGNEQYAGYMARKQTHLHKLAMVLAAAQSNELVIHEHNLRAADKIVTALESDMPLVFAQINTSDQSQHVVELLRYVESHDKVSIVELYRRFHMKMLYKDFVDVIDSAEKTGRVHRINISGVIYLRVNYSGRANTQEHQDPNPASHSPAPSAAESILRTEVGG